MKPIQLTAVRGGTYSAAHEEPVFCNPDLIRQFGQYGHGDERTFIDFGESDTALFVRESPSQILELIDRQRATLRAEERDGVLA